MSDLVTIRTRSVGPRAHAAWDPKAPDVWSYGWTARHARRRVRAQQAHAAHAERNRRIGNLTAEIASEKERIAKIDRDIAATKTALESNRQQIHSMLNWAESVLRPDDFAKVSGLADRVAAKADVWRTADCQCGECARAAAREHAW